MKIIRYPDRSQWADIVRRPQPENAQIDTVVKCILDDVKQHGDSAVIKYEEQFDHVQLSTLAVSAAEMDEAERLVAPELKAAIKLAHRNIEKFHAAQHFEGQKIETLKGVTCWQKSVPIERVGLYIPGGTAPLFSTVLMLATPAKIAGCKEIVLCTPPDKTGKVHPAILFAAQTAGVNTLFKVGGVQAIGAMAYGTQTIPQVYKIFGPGNRYVMTAKQQVSLHQTAIDMPAGPSEVCVIADETSTAAFVAADLLSQAEHGTDSQVLLITTSEELLKEVESEINQQLMQLPRKTIAEKALANSLFILVKNDNEAMALSNAYAPEHLIIATCNHNELATKVINAGSVFLGKYACESAGDYASGTNHTLPTHGYARAYSGVNLDSYQRKITFQQLDEAGITSIGRAVEVMAEAEQLQAHKQAMSIRIQSLQKSGSQKQ